MHTTRNVLAALAVCSLTALSACSGSDGGSDSASESKAPEKQADCTSDVVLTGAVKASWNGDASVITGGGAEGALYKTTNGDVIVSFLPTRGDVPATPIVIADGVTYTVQPDSKGVDIDPDGSGGTIKAKAIATKKGKPVAVKVDATFDC